MDLFEGTNKYLVKLFGQKLMKINFGFIAMTYSEDEFEREKLFKRFPILKEKGNYGKEDLKNKLNKILTNKIKQSVPQIRKNLQELLTKLKEKEKSILTSENLEELDTKGKGILMLSLINKYVQRAKKFIRGEIFHVGQNLQGSALINNILDNNFRKEIMSMNVLDVVKEEDIYTAVKNANGFRPSLFVSQKAFETVCRHMINKLKPISLDCADSVAAELNRLYKKIV